MYSKNEIKLLSSSKGLQLLLTNGNPDFKKTLDNLKYRIELQKMQAELIKVQNWVVENEKRVLVIVEGRDFAGKGGTIRAFTDRLNPRSMRLIALQKPNKKEQGQWYFKRYVEQIPEKGEMVFFDRSWYNRAIVEPVNGFCNQKEYKRFMSEVNYFERMLSEDGIFLFKYYLSLSKKEQQWRINHVENNPLKHWQLTDVDRRAQELWTSYTRFKEKMFKKTNTKANPWIIIKSDDIQKAHLEALSGFINKMPYK